MCYDISFTVAIKEITDYFPGLVFDDQLKMNFSPVHIQALNFAEHPIIYKNRDDDQLHLILMEWGCIPYYVKDEKTFKTQRTSMLNARSERILGDPKSYWYKIRNRRCLIPVTGIYEHRKVPGFKKKVPYFITLKKQPLFFLPGLYSIAELPDQETGELVKRITFTLITREANSVMAQIHNDGFTGFRMPLFLPYKLSKKWVEEKLTSEDYQALLDYKMPSEELDYIPVWTIRGNKERPDGKQKNEYFEWENLPALEV